MQQQMLYTTEDIIAAMSQPTQEQYFAEHDRHREACQRFSLRAVYLGWTQDDASVDREAEKESRAITRPLSLSKRDMGITAVQNLRQWHRNLKDIFQISSRGLLANLPQIKLCFANM